MKNIFIFVGFIAVILMIGTGVKYFKVFLPEEKVYVAVEGDGKIVVLNPQKQSVYRNIDLSTLHKGGILTFAPHNVQVAPDGKSVWVTANVSKHQDHALSFAKNVFAHGDEETGGEERDEVIVIDPYSDRIIQRIPIASGVHLAHVVFSPQSTYAYVTAQNENAIYKINAITFAIENKIDVAKGSGPHGIRIAPDGSVAYIAMLGSKSLGVLDLKTDRISFVSLGGAAVQTGVTPDGKLALVSLYDTKQLAVYDSLTKQLKFIQLPLSSRGPIQMYVTGDSRFVYLADQGYYFGQDVSEFVYKLDLEKFEVVKEIKAGKAPHGVVVSKDGKFVYVTNLFSNDVSIIDTQFDKEIARISVGNEPNGISIWSKILGGTP